MANDQRAGGDTRRGDMTYLSIKLEGRANVREPFNPPTMLIARPSGSILEVPLNEVQLFAIIKDATQALDRMRQSRHAYEPGGLEKAMRAAGWSDDQVGAAMDAAGAHG